MRSCILSLNVFAHAHLCKCRWGIDWQVCWWNSFWELPTQSLWRYLCCCSSHLPPCSHCSLYTSHCWILIVQSSSIETASCCMAAFAVCNESRAECAEGDCQIFKPARLTQSMITAMQALCFVQGAPVNERRCKAYSLTCCRIHGKIQCLSCATSCQRVHEGRWEAWLDTHRAGNCLVQSAVDCHQHNYWCHEHEAAQGQQALSLACHNPLQTDMLLTTSVTLYRHDWEFMHEACIEQGKVPLIMYMSSLISSRLSPMGFLTNYRLEWLWQIACYHCLIACL